MLRATVADLVAHGVVVRPPVRKSLNELVDLWVRRPDLQKLFRTTEGLPNIQSLLVWVSSSPDSSATGFLDDRGNFEELAGRMGILPVDGDPVPPLTWGLRNRARPLEAADGVAFRLASVWRDRPDVRKRFTANGRVDLRGLLFWAANLAPDDRSFGRLNDINHSIQLVLDELDGR